MHKEKRSKEKTDLVLVADSDQQSSSLITPALQKLGYAVLAARNGNEALELCADSERPINMAFIEIDLPDMSGPELFSRLLVMHPDTVVAYMSKHPDMGDRIRRHRYRFIQKPVQEGSIDQILHGLTSSRYSA
jgi:DNA-binding NtrC family response regulator